jgi:TolB protein
LATALALSATSLTAWGDGPDKPSATKKAEAPAPSEDVLGEFVVTGTVAEHIPKIAILPSLSPALEDVIVRSVVRRDLELSGMFRIIADKNAPPGTYGFSDPVDVKAWQSMGAEAVVKVAARNHESGRIEVLGLAYFPSAGAKPVYKTKLLVEKKNARKTAHQITDDLLGALTGRPGGFSSRFAFSGPWGRNLRVFAVDSDGYGLTPQSEEKQTSIGPTFGPGGKLYYSLSKNYSPYRLQAKSPSNPAAKPEAIKLKFKGSIYSSAFNKDRSKLAVAVSENAKSAIYEGAADGSAMKRISKTELATHPAYSTEGHLAWVGGSPDRGSQRVYVDGKPVSPAGFTASAPTFCDTEDGVFLVYAVSVGGGKQDLVMSRPGGKGLTRLTQNQGSNSYPACSPDGRLLAFFSTRKKEKGLYVLSLKRFTTKKVLGTIGEGLRWEALPREELTKTSEAGSATPAPQDEPKPTPLGPACGLAPAPKK